MVIDFHTHIFPDRLAGPALEQLRRRAHIATYTDGTLQGLLRSMADAGVDQSVILPVATRPEQVPHVNDAAILLARKHGADGILSFGGMHPAYRNWEAELERIAEAGLRGIKIHPFFQDTDLDDPRYAAIVRRAGTLGLVTVTHTGSDIGFPGEQRCTPAMARRLLDRTGDAPVVLAHMGGWRDWKEAEALLRDTPAYLDTSLSLGELTPLPDGPALSGKERQLLTEEAFTEFVHTFGAGRILFGTDSPWSSQSAAVRAIRALPLTGAEKEAVLGGSAARLLGL